MVQTFPLDFIPLKTHRNTKTQATKRDTTKCGTISPEFSRPSDFCKTKLLQVN